MLERKITSIADDVRATRHLVVAHDRDIADLQVEMRSLRSIVNALGEQTAGGFAWVRAEFADVRAEMRAGFAEMRAGFAEVRTKFDQQSAGQQEIVSLLTGLIESDGDGTDTPEN